MFSQGFSEVRSAKAIVRTHNCGIEQAVGWLMDHADDTDIDVPYELQVKPQSPSREKLHAILCAQGCAAKNSIVFYNLS